MSSRQLINTVALHQQFPAIYRQFFAHCQRVASASNSFLWTGEFAGFYGGLTVSQKLPIRSYVGLETTFDGSVTVVREYTTYMADEQQFRTAIIDDRLCDNLQNYLEKFYRGRTDFTGLKVHLLTEVPLGHGLGSNGAVAAALATLLDNSKVFDRARDILALSQAGHSSGVSAYMGLTDLSGPVVFFTQDDSFFTKSVIELAGLIDVPAWPVDFGLIYTGGGANAESVILANNQTIAELDADSQRLDQLLGGRQQLNFRQSYTEMLNLTSGLIVIALVDLFKSGAKNELLEQFFNGLNQYQNLLHILHIANGATDLIYSRIHQLANKQLNDVGSGVKISGIGKGGAVLFAVPYGSHRQAIVELVEEIRQQTGRPIYLDYASWLDGIGGQPAKIEQDLPQNVRSDFLARDAVAIDLLRQGKLESEIMTIERLKSLATETDILVDLTNGKVLVAGQSVTSKELPSQKAVCRIIADLITANNHCLSNDQLPTAYGSSRYDLQGKIVLPLVKLVKNWTGRELQLTISGGIYDEYQVQLMPSNLVIRAVTAKY